MLTNDPRMFNHTADRSVHTWVKLHLLRRRHQPQRVAVELNHPAVQRHAGRRIGDGHLGEESRRVQELWLRQRSAD